MVYATKDTLDKAGMVYDDIVPKIHDGKLEIMGIARSYGSGVNGGRGPLGESTEERGFAISIRGIVRLIRYTSSGMSVPNGLGSSWLNKAKDKNSWSERMVLEVRDE